MSFREKIAKYNKLSYGLIISLILPIFGFIISYFIKTREFDNVSFGEYFRTHILGNSMDQMDVLIFSMLPNMLLFYFVNFRWSLFEFTKGLVGVTLAIALLVIFLSL